jgi:hypothetical protein
MTDTSLLTNPQQYPPSKQLPSSLQRLDTVIRKHYPALLTSVHAMLAVFASMAMKGRTKPLSLIFETPSGYGKTATLQMAFPKDEDSPLAKLVYRSDKFTPRSFVSHAANVKKEDMPKLDLLPKLENRVLITKELAPILRGRVEELQDNFSILISVLDGKGFLSDSGMHGQRGYDRSILFNWIGATTPLPAATHRLMSQLGTRLLFFEVPAKPPTAEELKAYLRNGDPDAAERKCQSAVNIFLASFFYDHPISTIEPATMEFPDALQDELIRWVSFLVTARAEIRFENELPTAALPTEGPWKVANYFKQLAFGHALIHGRKVIDESDLAFVGDVALSSTPGHLRSIIRALRTQPVVDSALAGTLCGVSRPTARKYLQELHVLGIVTLAKGPGDFDSYVVTLREEYGWLRTYPESKVSV